MEKDFIEIIKKNAENIKDEKDLLSIFNEYTEYKKSKEQEKKQWDFNLEEEKKENNIIKENKLTKEKEKNIEVLNDKMNNILYDLEEQKIEEEKKKILSNNYLNTFKKNSNIDEEKIKRDNFIING